ncbi:hypothetical protein GQ600_19224 [Phytophthora cactorum]|nr:hypothetical protein GQ600_19224 [Phytophthora cactorum]
MEEEGAEYLIMHKLHWFTVPNDNLIGIGTIAGSQVEPCNERPCTGIVSFLDKRLGGASSRTECYQDTSNKRTLKVLAGSEEINDIS